jgi:uncharacterized spore protein YtfJ
VSLERMFRMVESLRGAASADAVFGEPQTVEGKVMVPVAATGTGFGMCFCESVVDEGVDETPLEEQDRAGGCGRARPVAVIEVTAEETVIRPIVDETKVFVAGIALMGWVLFWLAATVRSVFAGRYGSD